MVWALRSTPSSRPHQGGNRIWQSVRGCGPAPPRDRPDERVYVEVHDGADPAEFDGQRQANIADANASKFDVGEWVHG